MVSVRLTNARRRLVPRLLNHENRRRELFNLPKMSKPRRGVKQHKLRRENTVTSDFPSAANQSKNRLTTRREGCYKPDACTSMPALESILEPNKVSFPHIREPIASESPMPIHRRASVITSSSSTACFQPYTLVPLMSSPTFGQASYVNPLPVPAVRWQTPCPYVTGGDAQGAACGSPWTWQGWRS